MAIAVHLLQIDGKLRGDREVLITPVRAFSQNYITSTGSIHQQMIHHVTMHVTRIVHDHIISSGGHILVVKWSRIHYNCQRLPKHFITHSFPAVIEDNMVPVNLRTFCNHNTYHNKEAQLQQSKAISQAWSGN